MTPKEKAGCAIALITIFVRLPLLYAGTILLYKHVNAPDILWLLLFIGMPIALLVEVGSDFMKAGLFGKE